MTSERSWDLPSASRPADPKGGIRGKTGAGSHSGGREGTVRETGCTVQGLVRFGPIPGHPLRPRARARAGASKGSRSGESLGGVFNPRRYASSCPGRENWASTSGGAFAASTTNLGWGHDDTAGIMNGLPGVLAGGSYRCPVALLKPQYGVQ